MGRRIFLDQCHGETKLAFAGRTKQMTLMKALCSTMVTE